MTIRVVRLGSPRAAGEGVRIGTVRRPPRGVPFASGVWATWPCTSKRRLGVLLVFVRFEPVRSAEPPSISGKAAVNASSASCEALRLATVSAFSCAAITVSTAVCVNTRGSSPRMRRSSSRASSGCAAR